MEKFSKDPQRRGPTDDLERRPDRFSWLLTCTCRALREADRLITQGAYLPEPDGPERLLQDAIIQDQLQQVDRLIAHVEAEVPVTLEGMVALNAVLIAISDPYDSLADTRLVRGVANSVEHWLATVPDSPLRDDIEYLVNRPHILHAELSRAWVPGPNAPLTP
jgi:hypothetical protein